MPFFSVVIPTYNRAESLKKAIESVLKQTYADLELIVIDDGSTDETAELIKAIKDDRIRYLYQENRERSAARNRGMNEAKGKYICLLDSDDEFYPGHLQQLHEAISEADEPEAVFKTMMHYGDGSRPDDLSYAYKGNSREDAMKYVWKNGSQLICLCFHNEIGKKIHFPEAYFWFEDIHWLMRVVSAYPMKQLPLHTTKYNNRASMTLLSDNYKKYIDNCIACINDLEQKMGKEIKQLVGRKCFEERKSELYLGTIVQGAIATRQTALGFDYLQKAMKTCMTPRLMIKYVYYGLQLSIAALKPRGR